MQYSFLGQHDYSSIEDHTHETKTKKHKYGEYIYTGQVDEQTGEPHGVGIKIWWDGTIREGYWEYGLQNGYGRVIYWNGEYYIGDFKDDQYHGHGTYYYPSRKKYVGEWKDNLRHGNGVEFNADRSIGKSGKWKIQMSVFNTTCC